MNMEAIDAIRSVRLAAHELANVCSMVTGGTEMAISLVTCATVGKTIPADMKKLDDKLDKV